MAGRPHTFVKRSAMPVSAEELFRWHEAPGTFEKLTPRGEAVQVLERSGGIQNGARVVVRVGRWPFAFLWELEHRDYIFGRQFCDVQVRGPFRRYRHLHLMQPEGDRCCWLEDRIEFSLPLQPFSSWLAAPVVLWKFERLFAYRHRATLESLQIG